MPFFSFWFLLDVQVLVKMVFFPFLFNNHNLMRFLFSSTHILPITALELLYNATNGTGWGNNDGWVHFFLLLLPSFIFLLFNFFSSKMSGTVCNVTWYGVTCDMSDNVIHLHLVILPSHISPKNQHSPSTIQPKKVFFLSLI